MKLLLAALIFFTSNAFAVCRIVNQTKYSFVVQSGNVSNQRIDANTSVTIASGKIMGKSRDGKTFGGACRDGEELSLQENEGVCILVLK